MSTFDEIEELSARRQAIWSGAAEAEDGEIARIGDRLADLHEGRRIARAKETSGKGRSEIVRSAKLDAEIERLMTG